VKIAHVVTYISPDGAFGGPVRVALGQAEALAERGHDVTVYAAAPSELAGTSFQDGYTLKTFPARRVAPAGGFAAMAAPQLTKALKTDAVSFDVAHIHLARDLVTIPAARKFRSAGVTYVLQPHGMVDASRNPLAAPLDAWATKILLRDAAAVLTLTDREDADIAGIEPHSTRIPISNGIRVRDLPAYEGREDIVLFLARLHPRKRPLAFVEMAKRLRESMPTTRFVLVGPDEGEGAAVRSAIAGSGMSERLDWVGAVAPESTDDVIASARAYVLPAFDEVFPMTILESFRVGTPVITTRSLGIAGACERYGGALLTDGTPGDLARAVERVGSDLDVAERLRRGGLAYLQAELDVQRVATRLEQIYAAG